MNELNDIDNRQIENKEQRAFILRISLDRFGVMDALEANQIAIGWSRARGLRNKNLSWEEFRQIVSDEYYREEENMRRAGSAAGNMWRFIREMNQGDLVVVPHGANFYVAEVNGPPTYDETELDNDAAYRRDVNWLNDKPGIPRTFAKAALSLRMNTQNTSAYASDLLQQIKEVLKIVQDGTEPTFWGDLQQKLIQDTLREMRTGRMDDYRFEHLVSDVLINLGAIDAPVVARNKDKGADIIATFKVARVIRQTVAVQAKHWEPAPPVEKDVVDQLINGINAESADLGMIVTSGTFSEEAQTHAENYFQDTGIKIELVDGELLAKLIVEYGIKSDPLPIT